MDATVGPATSRGTTFFFLSSDFLLVVYCYFLEKSCLKILGFLLVGVVFLPPMFLLLFALLLLLFSLLFFFSKDILRLAKFGFDSCCGYAKECIGEFNQFCV